jgi:pimeloyl-ACP methyl ester carboxylesterase
VDAYRGGDGPGTSGQVTLDDYADQVGAVVNYIREPVHLIGFSWGGATALHVAVTSPEALASLTVIEPEAYSLLRHRHAEAFAEIAGLRDRWRERVRADRSYEAFEEFMGFYNRPGSFAHWPADHRDAFLNDQCARGDLWDVLFDAPLTSESLGTVAVRVNVIQGSRTSAVDHAICEVVLRHVPQAEHSFIHGAGHMTPLTHAKELTETLVAGIEGTQTDRRNTMIGVTVSFQYDEDYDRARVISIAQKARETFEGMPGLRSKAFTVDDARQRAMNFYVWESAHAAKSFFSEELRERVTSLYGVEPRIDFVEVAQLVDNTDASQRE